MGLAVVGELAAGGGDLDHVGVLGHRQGAQGLGVELVVVGHPVAGEHEGVGVVALLAADLGLGAGHGEGGVALGHQAVDLVALGRGAEQRGAVVDLGGVAGGHGVALRVHHDGAGRDVLVQQTGNVIAVISHHETVAFSGNGFVINIFYACVRRSSNTASIN